MDDRLMTPEEVADVLQVSAEWVRECARRGDLPSIKLGHYRRFTCSDVAAFIQPRRLRATTAPSMISAVIQNGSGR